MLCLKTPRAKSCLSETKRKKGRVRSSRQNAGACVRVCKRDLKWPDTGREGSINVAGKSKELREACGSKAPMMARRDHKDGHEGLVDHGSCGGRCKVKVA
jgi:hypothetical protein